VALVMVEALLGQGAQILAVVAVVAQDQAQRAAQVAPVS
jgi:hypothetical protein